MNWWMNEIAKNEWMNGWMDEWMNGWSKTLFWRCWFTSVIFFHPRFWFVQWTNKFNKNMLFIFKVIFKKCNRTKVKCVYCLVPIFFQILQQNNYSSSRGRLAQRGEHSLPSLIWCLYFDEQAPFAHKCFFTFYLGDCTTSFPFFG